MPHHLGLVALRFLIAVAVMALLPLSHVWFGQDPSTADIDGPQAFGFLFAFLFIGLILAVLFLVVASGIHGVLRKKPRQVLISDLLFGSLAVGLAVWAGVTAEYSSVP